MASKSRHLAGTGRKLPGGCEVRSGAFLMVDCRCCIAGTIREIRNGLYTYYDQTVNKLIPQVKGSI